jgi:hypothetical protein
MFYRQCQNTFNCDKKTAKTLNVTFDTYPILMELVGTECKFKSDFKKRRSLSLQTYFGNPVGKIFDLNKTFTST